LRDYVGGGGEATVQAWAPTAAGVLMETVAMRRQRVRLLHGIDTYIRSVAEATRRGSAAPLSVPLLS
jgi:hypothetical protein